MSGRRRYKLIVEDEEYGGRKEKLFSSTSLDDIREFVEGKTGRGLRKERDR